MKQLAYLVAALSIASSSAIAADPPRAAEPESINVEWTAMMLQLRHVAEALNTVLKERDQARADLAGCRSAAAPLKPPP